MSKLFAFGDSHAYGQGMPDCWIDEKVPGPEHSKLSWPSVLGGMLGKEVINKYKLSTYYSYSNDHLPRPSSLSIAR
jgi:hypothetical protein